MLDHLLFLELGSIQGRSSDSLYSPLYNSDEETACDGSLMARVMKNYLEYMKNKMTRMSEQAVVKPQITL